MPRCFAQSSQKGVPFFGSKCQPTTSRTQASSRSRAASLRVASFFGGVGALAVVVGKSSPRSVTTASVGGDAVEVLAAAQVDLAVDERRRRVEAVVEPVRGQELQLRAGREHGDRPFAARDVDASGGADG